MVEPSNAKHSAAFAITKVGQVVRPPNLPKDIGPQAWSTMTRATVAQKDKLYLVKRKGLIPPAKVHT